jgi:hypothetical protein
MIGTFGEKRMSNTEQRLWLAMASSLDTGDKALQDALIDGTWREAPVAWLRVARVLGHIDDAPRSDARLFASLAEHLAAQRTLEDPARTILGELCGALRWFREDECLGRLCGWLATKAQPGDAAVVVELLGRVHTNDPNESDAERYLPDEVLPLVSWLLRSGAAELRQHGRGAVAYTFDGTPRGSAALRGGDLLSKLAKAVWQKGDPELLVLALRTLLASARGSVPQDESALTMWEMVEEALGNGLSEGSVVDVVAHLAFTRPPASAGRWAPLEGADFPRARAALLRLLVDGAFGPDVTKTMMGFAIDHPFPMRPIAPAVVPTLLHHLRSLTVRPALVSTTVREDWAVAIVTAAARELQFRGRAEIAEKDLDAILGHEHLRPIAFRGLKDAWLPGTLAGDILTGGVQTYARAKAALAAARFAPQGAGPVRDVDLTGLRAELLRFVNQPWLDRVGGVDVARLLRGVTDVQLTGALQRDLKVQIQGEVLFVSDGFPRDAFSNDDPETAMIASCIYVVHELVHVAQGFDEMDAVRTARAIGAEMTIMQVDLAADHITTLLLATVRPDWTVEALKDRTGRALAEFPVGTFHTEASRQRKATRFVGCRFDLALRRLLSSGGLGDGFCWLDFSPGGERCLAFASWPTLRLLCPPLALTQAQREILVCAGDEGRDFATGLAAVDRVVGELAEVVRATAFDAK